MIPRLHELLDVLPEALAHRRIDQVAFLVEDLDEAIARWSPIYGADDWLVYTYRSATVPELRYRGEPARFGMRLALAGAAPQIELIQPLEGPSIYHDWIRHHGYGVHHLGFFVPSVPEAIDAFARVGIDCIQSGSGYGLDGDGGFAYFDVEETHQLVLEAIEQPRRRRPSEGVGRGAQNTEERKVRR